MTAMLDSGQRLYAIWAAAGGTIEDPLTFDRLSDLDRQRWQWLSRLVGQFEEDEDGLGRFTIVGHPDRKKYPSIPAGISFAEVDMARMVYDGKMITYDAWTQQKTDAARRHWWQLNRPRLDTLDLSFDAYFADVDC